MIVHKFCYEAAQHQGCHTLWSPIAYVEFTGAAVLERRLLVSLDGSPEIGLSVFRSVGAVL